MKKPEKNPIANNKDLESQISTSDTKCNTVEETIDKCCKCSAQWLIPSMLLCLMMMLMFILINGYFFNYDMEYNNDTQIQIKFNLTENADGTLYLQGEILDKLDRLFSSGKVVQTELSSSDKKMDAVAEKHSEGLTSAAVTAEADRLIAALNQQKTKSSSAEKHVGALNMLTRPYFQGMVGVMDISFSNPLSSTDEENQAMISTLGEKIDPLNILIEDYLRRMNEYSSDNVYQQLSPLNARQIQPSEKEIKEDVLNLLSENVYERANGVHIYLINPFATSPEKRQTQTSELGNEVRSAIDDYLKEMTSASANKADLSSPTQKSNQYQPPSGANILDFLNMFAENMFERSNIDGAANEANRLSAFPELAPSGLFREGKTISAENIVDEKYGSRASSESHEREEVGKNPKKADIHAARVAQDTAFKTKFDHNDGEPYNYRIFIGETGEEYLVLSKNAVSENESEYTMSPRIQANDEILEVLSGYNAEYVKPRPYYSEVVELTHEITFPASVQVNGAENLDINEDKRMSGEPTNDEPNDEQDRAEHSAYGHIAESSTVGDNDAAMSQKLNGMLLETDSGRNETTQDILSKVETNSSDENSANENQKMNRKLSKTDAFRDGMSKSLSKESEMNKTLEISEDMSVSTESQVRYDTDE